jgi:UDPglucose 6-dehydrogenase
MPEDTQIKVGVLGLGHVGLPTALGLAEVGWPVVGADDDREKAQRIARGEAPFYEPGLQEFLQRQLAQERFRVAVDVPTAVREATVLFICVGTPQREDGSADLSQVEGVARTIGSNLNGYKLIVEKSTAPVRTAEQLKRSILRYARADNARNPQKALGPGLEVAVNPEFLREGKALEDFLHPDRIVLGIESERARDTLLQIYQPLLDRLQVKAESGVIITDVKTAEIIKHASNAFLATKISFINMVADLCEAAGANVEAVARGMGLDPRIGSHFLKAGVGYGGYCLPKDLKAFTRIAEEHGVNFSLLREVDRINRQRVDWFLSKVRRAVWVVKGKTLAVWGLAFKPGTDDVREASSLGIVGRLLEEGANLRLYDPQAMGEFQQHFPASPPHLVYCTSPEAATEGAEALLLLTEWPEFLALDLAQVREQMSVPIIVDGRNLFDPSLVRRLGFEYYGVGRP